MLGAPLERCVQRAHYYITETIVFLYCMICVIQDTTPEDLKQIIWFSQWDYFVLFWDCGAFQWDYHVWGLGFILCGFCQWDFAVPEVNIYYYMSRGQPQEVNNPSGRPNLGSLFSKKPSLRFYGGMGGT